MTPPAPDDDRLGDFDKVAPEPAPVSFRKTTDPGLQAKYIRRKKTVKERREIDVTPDWEKDEAGPPDGDEADGDESHEGMEKRRRPVQKQKRIVTKTEKVFLNSPKLFIAIISILVAVLAVIAIIGVPKMAIQSPDAAIEAAQRSAEAAKSEEGPEIAPTFSTNAENEAAEEAIERYLKADGIDEKLKYVRRPDAVEPLMKSWFARRENAAALGPRSLAEVYFRRKLIIGDKTIFTVAAQVAPALNVQFFAIEKISDTDYKVDWEVSEGYQDMPLSEFKQARPTTPTRFRVQAVRSDYFNKAFSDPGTHDCYLLKYPGRPDFEIYGYAEHDTPASAAMFVSVPPGTSLPMILDLRFPEDPETDNQVIIESVNRANWFLD